MFSTVPAVLFGSEVYFVNLVFATGLGVTVAAGLALYSVRYFAHGLTFEWSLVRCKFLICAGGGLTALRILHVTSFWIPTIVSGFLLSPALAGEMGTAGRLAIAISGVIAAIRFSIRPVIHHAVAKGNLMRLRYQLGSIAFITTAAGLLALIANVFVGEKVIGFFFGPQLSSATTILSVLLVSVCAEAVFSPVDELLKANGLQKAVTLIYAIGVSAFFIGSVLVANLGLMWIAWLQVIYVLGVFSAMNYLSYIKLGFSIFPSLPNFHELKMLK